MDMITPDALNDDEALILNSVDRFLEIDVKPYVHALEAADEYPAEIVEQMKELGLFGATIPAGVWRSRAVDASPTRRSSSASRAVWMSVSGHLQLAPDHGAVVQRNGTEAQKQAFLPRFATGETARRPRR